MTGFSTKKNVESNTEVKTPTEYVRDTSDNPMFTNIQVNDLSNVTDVNTRWKLDGDGVVWKACASQETLYIEVNHKSEDIFVELRGVQEFKGLGKGISENSWLGIENIKRERKELPIYGIDDFEVVQKSKLNLSDEDKAFEQATIIIRTKLKNLRNQFGINNIDFCIGEGACFRESLNQVNKYKGERSPLRPILLKRVRAWVLDELKGEKAPEGFENDDYVEWFGYTGSLAFNKTGIYSFGCIAEDKDSLSNPKLLINFGVHSGKDNPKKGQWKFPQAMSIPNSSVSIGEMDLVLKGSKKECKATGLKWLIVQAFLTGDQADGYKALQHLPKSYGIKYGDVAAYTDFVDLSTGKEVVQKVVDLYAELLPHGVQYQSHKKESLDVPTIEYMNTYFLTAYMTRSSSDTMDFYKLCKAFKVDTSKIENNNLLTPPKRTFISDVKTVEDMVVFDNDVLLKLLLTQLKGYKSLKKDLLVERMDDIKDCLTDITDNLESYYEMKQEVKVFDKLFIEE